MRKILWTVLLFAAYIWAMTSGHDQMILRQCKYLYQFVVSWLDDAEVDFQLEHTSKIKQPHKKTKSRRWD